MPASSRRAALVAAAALVGAGATPRAAVAQAVADSAAPAAPPRQVNVTRASWLSDKQPLRVGDIVTIVVDEQLRARENTRAVASNTRNQRNTLNNAGANPLGPTMNFGSGSDASSRDVGEAGRDGSLTAVITTRVVEIDALGNARIEGSKKVTIDGRTQEVALEGRIRPDDVSFNNLVSSERVADAVITYKGKKLGPRQGILGKLLTILWP